MIDKNSPSLITRNRHSIRMKGYDYSLAGAYFVTIISFDRLLIFGDVEDGQVKINEYGEIARDEWFRTMVHRSYIKLDRDEFIVMPNHVHGIICIMEMNTPCRGAASLRPYDDKSSTQSINVVPASLGAIVRAYKSAVTYKINLLRNSRGAPVWQRNYYDHIIRDEKDHEVIWSYIHTNPTNWFTDDLHSTTQN